MEIFKNFGIQPVLLLAQIVNFTIILFLLSKFFYKPISKALENRKRKIEESLKNAQAIEEKLEKTQEETSIILEEAQKNAQAIITDAKAEAQRIASQASLDARRTIEEALGKAKVQIEAHREAIEKQLEKETLNLVVAVVKKVLDRHLRPTERQELTTKALGEISRKIS